MATSIANTDDFECSHSFLINFTSVVEDCDFNPDTFTDPGDPADPSVPVVAGRGVTNFRKNFVFIPHTRSRAGDFKEHVSYASTPVGGGATTISVNRPPEGVTFSGGFSRAPQFPPAVNAFAAQKVNYAGQINIIAQDPNNPSAAWYQGQALTVTVTLGMDPRP